ncbi:class I SAM-dependent methyltransferase [Reyranella aquatilis]|uniref:Class I SAM-dependent methyltransferase n=1 Tax=Reyranella aquatilis TaxID=2035356 RepID=A0ABS8KS42_9HYPH|nr:class I SAM-dependent methyltransferase [Reyranella aquatilis]MCC8428893.1 class I SAM-dependent methyltransferase [Reyranella aquatilis]
MAGDPWLARWLPLLAERAGGRPVLELGCGGGRDTATLAEAGHRVIGVELLAAAASRARDRVPSAEIHCQDIRAPLPITGPAGVVLASLSLHYFGWAETCDLVDRVRDALAPEGVLLCRLNSTNDHHFGASGHPEIEKNFYEVDGAPKRFFDREAIDRLFARGWRALAIGEMVIDRYDHPKSVWEAVLERND